MPEQFFEVAPPASIRVAKRGQRPGPWFRSGPGKAEVWIYAEIPNDVEPLVRELQELNGSLRDGDQTVVRINSPGGDAFGGLAIHNMLQRLKGGVLVYVDGLAASAASVIAMAGDRIVMAENAMMMIHEPWSIAAGSASDMKAAMEALDRLRDSLAAIYEKRTGNNREQILALMRAETWMTGVEAIDLGFADELQPAVEMAASVRFDLSAYKNAPSALIAAMAKLPPPDGQAPPAETDAGRVTAITAACIAAKRPDELPALLASGMTAAQAAARLDEIDEIELACKCAKQTGLFATLRSGTLAEARQRLLDVLASADEALEIRASLQVNPGSTKASAMPAFSYEEHNRKQRARSGAAARPAAKWSDED